MHILFYRFCTVLWYWVIWLFCPGCIRFHFVSCSRFPLNAGFPQISGWQWSFFSSVLLCPCCDCPAQAGLGWRDGVWWCPPPPPWHHHHQAVQRIIREHGDSSNCCPCFSKPFLCVSVISQVVLTRREESHVCLKHLHILLSLSPWCNKAECDGILRL